MKRMIAVLIALLLGCILCNTTVYAQETPVSYDETLSTLFEATGMEELLKEQNLDEILDTQMADDNDPQVLSAVTFQGVIDNLISKALDTASIPLQVFGMLLGVILISAIAQSMQSSRESVKAIYEMICVLCAVGVVVKPIGNVLLLTSQRLEASAGFMLNFSVIFASVLTVCGGLTTAVAYQTAILGACEAAMQLAVHVLLPILSMGLALSIVDAVNPSISLDGIVKLLHKGTVWVLGLMMSLFLGILSLQSMTGVASDKLASKTTKFMISNFIPFVGGAISDAYSTVMGSMGVLKTTTGVIGILSVLSLFLPVLLELVIYRFMMALSGAIAEIFAVERVARLLKNMERILAAAFSVAVSFSVIFVVSTALLLLISGNLIST